MWVDVAVVAFLAIFAILGYVRGLFSQAWSLGALVLAAVSANTVLEVLRNRFGVGAGESLLGDWFLKLIVGVCIYVALLFLGYLLEKLLVERFKLISAGNRVLGALLGLVKGGLGILVAVWFASFYALVSDSPESNLHVQLVESRVARVVAPYNPLNLLLLARVKPYLPSGKTGSGSRRTPVEPPKEMSRYLSFVQLRQDTAFLDAYRKHDYLGILRNTAFKDFVREIRTNDLLQVLEKSQH